MEVKKMKMENRKNKKNKKVKNEKQENIEIGEVFFRTMERYFPKMLIWMKEMKDPRNPKKITYEMSNFIWIGILLFLCKLKSRRQIDYNFDTYKFIQNLNILTGTQAQRTADQDSLAYLLEKMYHGELDKLIVKMIYRLLRMKFFENSRLLEKYYLILIDGTGHLSFGERKHCEGCLSEEHKETKKTYYYHTLLEAKIIGPNGMVLSICTEFIENSDGKDKQDCEINAFKRLAKILKNKFPQLKICLLLDGLFAGVPIIEICEKNKWKYIITFKEGKMKEVWKEYITIAKLSPENVAEYNIDDIKQKYRWAEDIMQYKSNLKVNALECIESKPGKEDIIFVWITNLYIDKNNFYKIAEDGGRLRWKIENEGFNMQKNGGYELEHAYSLNPNAIKNFYLLLQIAHTISQLMEKGKALMKLIKKIFGSIKNIAVRLLESLRYFILPITKSINEPSPVPVDSS